MLVTVIGREALRGLRVLGLLRLLVTLLWGFAFSRSRGPKGLMPWCIIDLYRLPRKKHIQTLFMTLRTSDPSSWKLPALHQVAIVQSRANVVFVICAHLQQEGACIVLGWLPSNHFAVPSQEDAQAVGRPVWFLNFLSSKYFLKTLRLIRLNWLSKTAGILWWDGDAEGAIDAYAAADEVLTERAEAKRSLQVTDSDSILSGSPHLQIQHASTMQICPLCLCQCH